MMCLLLVTIGMSAQKITIKTSNGQTVEISCEGMVPSEVMVINDSVVFKIPAKGGRDEGTALVAETPEVTATSDSTAVAIVAEETPDSVTTALLAELTEQQVDTAKVDTLRQNMMSGSEQATLGLAINSLVEEYVPEYAEFNREHQDTKFESEKDAVKTFAKGFLDEDVVETADLLGTLFSGIRFTSDTTFVARYEQRKPKKLLRTYDVIVAEGSFGKNIEGVSDAVAKEVSYDDYGDDTENENKIGAGIQYSHIYISGTETDGQWKPNPMGFAWSWGGILTYSYEQDMGSYVNAMGKAGIQVGQDIAIGVDGLLGCGVTPYNTFYTNYINHSVLNQSTFCLKYGLQLWGTLTYAKDAYTMVYARYIRSVKPKNDFSNLPEGWELVVKDFDPSSWTVGLAVGYKFGAPKELSTDKRLQATVSSGYRLFGKQKGWLLSAEVERFTQVSHSTKLHYGLSVEMLSDNEDSETSYSSVLATAGFTVRQPSNRWYWGTKLYGGVGDYKVIFTGAKADRVIANSTKKLCGKVALQLNSGFKLGKCSNIFAACRFGYHIGKSIQTEGFEELSYDNLKGFEFDLSAGYRFIF